MQQIEVRSTTGLVSLNAATGKNTTSTTIGVACGYCIRYSEPSHAIAGNIEQIEPGAATRSLESGRDVTALFEHENGKLLGRTSAGTLRLQEDRHGVYFELDLPDTTVGRDLSTLLQRGDITGSSFGFASPVVRWSQNEHGYPIRHVTDLELHHISPVSVPAYATTTAEVRI